MQSVTFIHHHRLGLSPLSLVSMTQINVTNISHRLNHEHNMSTNVTANVNIDIAIDIYVNVNADNPCFHGPISSDPNIFSPLII
jgi:hypothetical protein